MENLDTREAGMLGNLDHVIAVTRQLDIGSEESASTETE
jgi:hypothetical protein